MRELRKKLGLSQVAVAEKISSSSKNIWAYENDVATPPAETLASLADCFGCSVDYLLGRCDDFGNTFIQKTERFLYRKYLF